MTDADIAALSASIARLRRDRIHGSSHSYLEADPIRLFARWLHDVLDASVEMPHAMTLGTVGASREPSARIVLLKGFDERGFVFYTNYESTKARELAENPHASLVFYWARLERQVRIRGIARKTSSDESNEYFATRPRGSQIGAWASPQSRVIEGRDELELDFARHDESYSDGPVPRPPHWGGFRVEPVDIEFWQGQPNRLHDRWLYTRSGLDWTVQRLAP